MKAGTQCCSLQSNAADGWLSHSNASETINQDGHARHHTNPTAGAGLCRFKKVEVGCLTLDACAGRPDRWVPHRCPAQFFVATRGTKSLRSNEIKLPLLQVFQSYATQQTFCCDVQGHPKAGPFMAARKGAVHMISNTRRRLTGFG